MASTRWVRHGGWAVAVVLALQAGAAQACAPFQYDPVIAQARIRDSEGAWRPARVEASGSHIRIEYAEPSLRGGRLVLVSNVLTDRSYLFRLAGKGSASRATRAAQRVSTERAMARFGLPPYFLQQHADEAHPVRFINGLACHPATADHFNPPQAFILCIHESRLPLAVAGSDGRNVFEVESLVMRDIPARRFSPPGSVPADRRKPRSGVRLACGR